MIKYSTIVLFCVLFFSCAIFRQTNNDLLKLKDGNYQLEINPSNFQLEITDKNGNIVVPKDSVSGLFINGSPVVNVVQKSISDQEMDFSITTVNQAEAEVSVFFKNGIIKIGVAPKEKKKSKVSIRFGGMPVAHGLGDAGAFGDSFNLVEKETKTFEIVNNGGTKRWLSTFTLFPKNEFAGVFFNRGKKNVVLSKRTYQLNAEIARKSAFYFFIGDTKEIYANYKKLRKEQGFQDIKPKSRLFELGWESWDALGWNTNQQTVKDILSKFHKEGYPIRWAVTGSGFWDEGGTTTSFGRFGNKFPNPDEFKSWMHQNDIYWMIGLRTNLIPSGEPYFPITEKRDKNLKVRSFYGNDLSDKAVAQNLLLTDVANQPLKLTSTIFPIVPAYLIDGNKSGAAAWFQQNFSKWKVDGIKEDTMMDLEEETSIFNKPIAKIATEGGLVMARCGEFSAPGTLLRINDTRVETMTKRAPINYMQYAACGFPNVYSDVAGVHNMHNTKSIAASIRHTWMLSLTAGMAVGAFPSKWAADEQIIFKKAIDFHYTLVPYLYSAGMKSYETGFPFTLTPLSIAYPEDDKAIVFKNFQWLIGESLLASPLLKNYKEGKKDVYLPDGIWFDYETNEKYKGPITLSNYPIPLNKIPAFIGGKGMIILRDKLTNALMARVYAVEKKAVSNFYSLKDGAKYQVEVLNTNLNDIEVWNKTTNKRVTHKIGEWFVEFPITEGQDYELR